MVATLIFYNSVVLISTFLVWLSERVKTKLQSAFVMFLALLIVALPVGLRYGLGRDYFSYQGIFNKVANGEILNIELGFIWLNKLVGFFGLGYEGFTILFSFLIYAVAMYAYPKRNKALIHFLFLMLLFFQSFNQIRSVMVLSIMLVAVFQYSKDKKIRNYLMLIGLASLFHISAILYLIVPAIQKIITRRNYNLLTKLSIILIFIVFAFNHYVVDFIFNNPLTSYMGFNTYSGGKYDVEGDFGSGLGYIARFLILMVPLFLVKRTVRYNSDNITFYIVIALSLLAVVLKPVSLIFERLELVFLIAYIFGIYMLYPFRRNLFVAAFIICTLAFNFLIFNKDIIEGTTDYKAVCVDGARRITPYTSIFNKEDFTRVECSK